MPEQWVVNASPLIVLARIGYENLLFDFADETVIPAAVQTEINNGPLNDAARLFLRKGSIPVVQAYPPAELIAWDLGAGETAVLAYALANPGWVAILDDGAARKCARSFYIPHKGTLGVILMAKRRGLIPSATEILHALRANGFRLDDNLLQDVLPKAVGEIWK